MGRSPSYISPSKRLRNISNLVKFLKSKVNQNPTKIPTLSSSIGAKTSLPPKMKQSHFAVVSVQNTSIPPRPIYHPAIIGACLSMSSKKPGELNSEEMGKKVEKMEIEYWRAY